MKYTIKVSSRGYVKYELRLEHIDLLYNIYCKYGINPWRSDIDELFINISKKNYFLERMRWPFFFIEDYTLTVEELNQLVGHQKQMNQYIITVDGLEALMSLGYDISSQHIILIAKERLIR